VQQAALLQKKYGVFYRDYIEQMLQAGNIKDTAYFNVLRQVFNGQAYKDLQPSDQAYIDAVNKYMQQRGYAKVTKESNPDIGIDVNRIYNTSTGYYSYDDYWDYYDGYWDPYYWGYGGYGYYVPTSYGIYQITEGAMSVDMLDLKHASEKNKIEVIWNGLIRGENIFSSATAEPAVKALFDQSTYLQSN